MAFALPLGPRLSSSSFADEAIWFRDVNSAFYKSMREKYSPDADNPLTSTSPWPEVEAGCASSRPGGLLLFLASSSRD